MKDVRPAMINAEEQITTNTTTIKKVLVVLAIPVATYYPNFKGKGEIRYRKCFIIPN